MPSPVIPTLAALSLLLALPAAALSPTPQDPPILETVVVTGHLPGPGLWRISNGDRVLWILGTVSPLPRDMTWDSDEVEALVAEADEIIAPAGSDADIGAGDVLKMALLANSARKAMRNPDRQTLQDVLPPDIHARWLAAKKKYPGTDPKVDTQRPMFASQDLYYSAITASGMTRSDIVWSRVQALAEAHQVPVVSPRVEFPLAIDRARYKAGIRALSESRIDDTSCFAQTLNYLALDLEDMRHGANAWATGDFDRLRRLDHAARQPACKPVYDAAMGFQQRPGLSAQVAEAWRDAARAALQHNTLTLAVAPLRDLLGPEGHVEALLAQGYVVRPPAGAVASD